MPSEFLPSDEHFDEIELRLDVNKVLLSLPHQLVELSRMLGELPMAEICSRLGRSRTSVYKSTLQLRAAFIGAGFGPKSETRRPQQALRGRHQSAVYILPRQLSDEHSA